MNDPFTTAMQLLAADQPRRHEVERAGELLEEASSRGHAQASERCALFEAFGMARPQSWNRALDFLTLAAAQGSRSAQEQLLLLNDSGKDPEPPETSDDSFWSGVRQRIDLEQRITPGERIILSERPRMRAIKAFATAPECRWLISLAADRLAPATVFNRETGGQSVDASRDNSYLVMRFGEMNVLTEVIRNRIAAATRLPPPLFEPFQVLHYATGQRFKLHHDFLDPTNSAYRDDLARFGQRIATLLIYLNDDYSGGETVFPSINFRFRGETGDALFFANVTQDGAPDPLTLHAGEPPASGEKWVFSQWIRGQLPSG